MSRSVGVALLVVLVLVGVCLADERRDGRRLIKLTDTDSGAWMTPDEIYDLVQKRVGFMDVTVCWCIVQCGGSGMHYRLEFCCRTINMYWPILHHRPLLLRCPSMCDTPLHSTPLHSTPLHSTPLHSTPLHSSIASTILLTTQSQPRLSVVAVVAVALVALVVLPQPTTTKIDCSITDFQARSVESQVECRDSLVVLHAILHIGGRRRSSQLDLQHAQGLCRQPSRCVGRLL
jgi:hypothetical protein